VPENELRSAAGAEKAHTFSVELNRDGSPLLIRKSNEHTLNQVTGRAATD
jgi:hypothetical protein